MKGLELSGEHIPTESVSSNTALASYSLTKGEKKRVRQKAIYILTHPLKCIGMEGLLSLLSIFYLTNTFWPLTM